VRGNELAPLGVLDGIRLLRKPLVPFAFACLNMPGRREKRKSRRGFFRPTKRTVSQALPPSMSCRAAGSRGDGHPDCDVREVTEEAGKKKKQQQSNLHLRAGRD